MARSPSRVTSPESGPSITPTTISQITSGTPVFSKMASPTTATSRMPAMARRKMETGVMPALHPIVGRWLAARGNLPRKPWYS
jgi:hypothetical protein